jgi:twinkle protein
MSNLIAPDDIDFDSYFEEQQVDRAKIRKASSWVDGCRRPLLRRRRRNELDRTGFDKMAGKFDLRPGEVTLWAGINKHGKTTKLSHVMLNVMRAGRRCASPRWR